jgi:two-component system, sensor histidine kinase
MTRKLFDLARWQARQWALALSGLLLVTLTPLVWIQWQQFRLLDDVSTNQVDSIMWQAYQLEREMGRLQTRLKDAGDPAPVIDEWELLESYEVFLSRINLITKIPRATCWSRRRSTVRPWPCWMASSSRPTPCSSDRPN